MAPKVNEIFLFTSFGERVYTGTPCALCVCVCVFPSLSDTCVCWCMQVCVCVIHMCTLSVAEAHSLSFEMIVCLIRLFDRICIDKERVLIRIQYD